LGSDIYKTGFNNARLAGYKGICYVQLQKPQLALEALTESLEIDSQSMRHKLRVTIDMAMAYAQQGELEKGCSLASMALNTTKQAGTLMILPRLQKFRQIVEPWRNSKHVREFDEQLLLA
jgi:tetratricopeptide (TPR) repeat protein